MVSVVESPVIKTNCGSVRGRTYGFANHSAAAFLGIPYGRPPLGKLRFKKPEKPDEWTQVRDCNHFGACCPFVEPPGTEFLPRVPHSEDCLFLNVFASVNENNTVKTNLAVLFYIHGGGYMMGNSALCGDIRICQYLCSKDVIVVTINYRLGLFGFLSTGDSNAPGNYGLWDQVMALQWVRDNIVNFGGNPQQITVFGHSAGGSASDLLCLSPHSRDLFQNIAPMAGSSFNNWALTQPQKTLKKALSLAKRRGFAAQRLGTQEAQNAELVDFLRQLPAEQLKTAAHGIPTLKQSDVVCLHLAPVYDGKFFPKPIHELRTEARKRNVLTGVTTYEGLIFGTMRDSQKVISKGFIKTYLQDRNNASKADRIFERMLSEKGADQDKMCIHIMSDLFISFGTYEMAQYYRKLGGDVFVYTFDHIRLGITGAMEQFLPFLGASHGTENCYLFGMTSHSDFHPTPEDEQLMHKFCDYFANFSKTGDPNGFAKHWAPITRENPLRHNVVKLESDEQRDDFCGGRPLLWHQLLENTQSKL